MLSLPNHTHMVRQAHHDSGAHGSAGSPGTFSTMTEQAATMSWEFHIVFFHQQNTSELQGSLWAHKRLKNPLFWCATA
jgi:hypothetical protein